MAIFHAHKPNLSIRKFVIIFIIDGLYAQLISRLDGHCKHTVGRLREVVFHSRKKTILLLELITKTLHVIYIVKLLCLLQLINKFKGRVQLVTSHCLLEENAILNAHYKNRAQSTALTWSNFSHWIFTGVLTLFWVNYVF